MRAASVPPDRRLRLAGMDIRPFANTEAEIRESPPGVVEKLAYVGVPAHGLRPRRVVIYDIVGHELEHPLGAVRVPSTRPALDEAGNPLGVGSLADHCCLLRHRLPLAVDRLDRPTLLLAEPERKGCSAPTSLPRRARHCSPCDGPPGC